MRAGEGEVHAGFLSPVLEIAVNVPAPAFVRISFKDEDDLTLDHFQTAYDELSKGYRNIIALLQAIPELAAPDLNPSPLAKAEGRQS